MIADVRRAGTRILMASIGVAALVLAAGLVAGCADDDRQHDRNDTEPEAVQSKVSANDVALVVRATPKQSTVGDRISLTVEVVAPRDAAIEMPQLEGPLGEFTILDAHTPPDVPDGGVRRWTQRYLLDTFAAGELEIPPVTVRYRVGPSTTEDPPPARELTSEPLAVTITSVLSGAEQPTDFRDIKGVVDVPRTARRPATWIIAIAVAGVLLVIVLVAILLIRRRRGLLEVEAPPPPPHVWARRELESLAADRLIEKQRFHEFYYRLSDIVRQYVERRFGIMAPEQTTEEFLRDMRRRGTLSEHHKVVLAEFLRAADMVKFARHEPEAEDGERAFAAASSFVDETTPHDGQPPAARETPRTPAGVRS